MSKKQKIKKIKSCRLCKSKKLQIVITLPNQSLTGVFPKSINEKMFRKDYKYDYIIPINYNTKNTLLGKGSAIFLHLTNNFKPTAGCIALQKKDFLILLKIINKKTKIILT